MGNNKCGGTTQMTWNNQIDNLSVPPKAVCQFLAELLLCYVTGNIFGVEISCGRRVDNMQMICGWHESETSGEISLEDDICCPHDMRMTRDNSSA